MGLFFAVALFVFGVFIIVKSGDWFVDGAVWVAEVTGIPKFIIGATVVSVATTLPEILVSTIAAIDGRKILASGAGNLAAALDKVGMAVGNGVGSVICNTAMILAFSIIFMPAKLSRRDFVPKALILSAAVTVLFLLSLGGSLSLGGAFVLLAVFALYIFENIRSAKNGGADSAARGEVSRGSAVNEILRLLIGTAGIVIGSRLLVDNGSRIAAALGVSEAMIGVTVVAVGTSLPELVTAVASVIKKQPSMTVGNIIGANVIDTTLILAVCAFIYGGRLPVSAQNIYLDFPVAVIVSLIAIVPAAVNKKFSRWQGVVLLAVYAVYLIIVVGGIDRYLSIFGVRV